MRWPSLNLHGISVRLEARSAELQSLLRRFSFQPLASPGTISAPLIAC